MDGIMLTVAENRNIARGRVEFRCMKENHCGGLVLCLDDGFGDVSSFSLKGEKRVSGGFVHGAGI